MVIAGYDFAPLAKYFKPNSLTWWASVIPLVSGVAQLYDIELPVFTQLIRPFIQAAYPDVTPFMLINLGLGGIGLRAALIREIDD